MNVVTPIYDFFSAVVTCVVSHSVQVISTVTDLATCVTGIVCK